MQSLNSYTFLRESGMKLDKVILWVLLQAAGTHLNQIHTSSTL